MTPPKQENGIPKWILPLIIAFVCALATVGTISITNAASFASHKESQKTQFQDIKDRLMRIEYKIDSNKEH